MNLLKKYETEELESCWHLMILFRFGFALVHFRFAF